MSPLKRNRKKFWYCLYLGSEEIRDDQGNLTGEIRPIYAEPVMAMGNISPATGLAQTEMFGNVGLYDKVIAPMPVDCEIDENTVLIIDEIPVVSAGMPNFNYIVKRRAESLNHISYLISKVDVS